jgi:hypothetical protein
MTRARGDYVVAGDRPAATPPARCGGIGTAWLNVRGIFRPGVRLPESAHPPLRRPNRSRASRLIQFRQASTGRLSRRDPACREDQGGPPAFPRRHGRGRGRRPPGQALVSTWTASSASHGHGPGRTDEAPAVVVAAVRQLGAGVRGGRGGRILARGAGIRGPCGRVTAHAEHRGRYHTDRQPGAGGKWRARGASSISPGCSPAAQVCVLRAAAPADHPAECASGGRMQAFGIQVGGDVAASAASRLGWTASRRSTPVTFKTSST